MLDNVKQKLHAKTVEFNRANKKLQNLQKNPTEEDKKPKQGTLLDQLLAAERDNKLGQIKADERRVLLLKAQNASLAKRVQVFQKIIRQQKKVTNEARSVLEQMEDTCKAYAIKDDQLAAQVGQLKGRLEGCIRAERTAFNSGDLINSENDYYKPDEEELEKDLNMTPNKSKLFYLE